MTRFATLTMLALTACAPSAEDLNGTRGGRVDVFFNEPGTRRDNMWEPDAIDIMVDMIDGATASIDFAVMGFGRDEVIDAMIRAYERGVVVRMVGDAGHLYNDGYERFYDRGIPIVVGNEAHIMHDKFMVVDSRFTMAGTANWTDTDLRHNSNNFFVIDSGEVASDFTNEFEKMFGGTFGHLKDEDFNGRSYVVGDTEVEVWFSPNEDSLGRMLELIDGAEQSVRFTIFAFTKDQVGSSLIAKQEQFLFEDGLEGIDLTTDFRTRKSVAGLIDKSQLHSNGQYHETYRLLAAEIPMRLDGNDNGKQPGDYQAGGGRLHSKTMIIDVEGEDPVVISGSFNWSSSATVSNDEFMMVFKGGRVAKMYDEYFESLWANGKEFGNDRIGRDGLESGDIVINEVGWYGRYNYQSQFSDLDVLQNYSLVDNDGFDQFIELRNTTDKEISLDMWQINKAGDFVVGMPPGSTILPNETFLILDHTMEPYSDGQAQHKLSAYKDGDLIVNAFNDNRQSRLYLNGTDFSLTLQDPDGGVMDVAGDGGPAFAGGIVPNNAGGFDYIVSMERTASPGDGTDPANWKQCAAVEGGENVNEPYRPFVIATPGEPNSD